MQIGNLVRISSDEDLVIRECGTGYAVGFNEDMKPDIGRYGRIIKHGSPNFPFSEKVMTSKTNRGNEDSYTWPHKVLTEIEEYQFRIGQRVWIMKSIGYLKGISAHWKDQYDHYLGKMATIRGLTFSDMIFLNVEDDSIQAVGHKNIIQLESRCILPEDDDNPACCNKDLDRILELLYDAHKAHQDCKELLEMYRAMTGNRWPGFMD